MAYNLPYNSQNPSGIGNVVFQQGPSPLEVHLDNLRTFDVGMQRRKQEQQQKLKVTSDLLGDLNPNIKGIRDTDVPFFQEQTRGLHDFTTQALLHGLDPNTPQGAAVANDIKFRGKQIQLYNEASTRSKERLIAAQKALDAAPQKWDIDASNTKIAKERLMPVDELVETGGAGELLVPKQFDTNKYLVDLAKNFKPDITSRIVNLPGGGTTVETVTDYAPKELATVAMQNPEFVEQKKNEFNNLDPATKASIVSRAGSGDVVKVMAEDFYTNYLPNEQRKLTSPGYSPMERQYASLWGAAEKEQEDVGYIVDRLSQALNGEDASYTKPTTGTNEVALVEGGGTVPVDKKSGILSGMPLGQASIPRYKDGALQDIETFPNKVIDFAWINGKAYVQTAKSQLLHLQGLGNAYVPVGEDFLDDLTAGSKNPIKTKEALKKELIKRGLYNNGQFNFGPKAKPVTKTAATGKKTTKAKIRSLVGTKGYEGYDEKELTEYYKSQGYTIE